MSRDDGIKSTVGTSKTVIGLVIESWSQLLLALRVT